MKHLFKTSTLWPYSFWNFFQIILQTLSTTLWVSVHWIKKNAKAVKILERLLTLQRWILKCTSFPERFYTYFFWKVTLNQKNFVHEDCDIYNVEVKPNGSQNLSLHLEDLVLVIGVVCQIAQGLHLSIILQTLTCKIKSFIS